MHLVYRSIALFCTAVDAQDFPILDQIADKVIQKYQTSTCEQLWQERAKGKHQNRQIEQKAPRDVEIRPADARGIRQQDQLRP